MSNKTIALLGVGFVATLIVGVLLGVVVAKTILAPTIAITRDDVFGSMQFMVDEGFQTGMMVVEVVEGSPAEEAGLEDGDVIMSVDGEEINIEHPLAEIIRGYDVGDQIEIQISHDGEERMLEATLGEHPEDGGLAFLGVVGHARFMGRGFSAEGFRHNRDFGMEEGMPFDHPEFDFEMMGGPGLVVMHVAGGSPAEESGLLPADIILAVDGVEIAGFDQFADIIRSQEPRDGIILSVVRDGEEQELDIVLGEHPEEEGRAYLGVMGFGLHEFMPDKLRPGLNFESQG